MHIQYAALENSDVNPLTQDADVRCSSISLETTDVPAKQFSLTVTHTFFRTIYLFSWNSPAITPIIPVITLIIIAQLGLLCSVMLNILRSLIRLELSSRVIELDPCAALIWINIKCPITSVNFVYFYMAVDIFCNVRSIFPFSAWASKEE